MQALLKTSLSPEPQKTALQPPLPFSECACKTLTGRHLRTLGYSLHPILRCSLSDTPRTGHQVVKLMTAGSTDSQELALTINKLTGKVNDRFVHERHQQSNPGGSKP